MTWKWDFRGIPASPAIPGVTDLRPLGSGGMGQVYQGIDSTSRRVAVKVMRRLDAASIQRFQREAQLLARFDVPEIVTAHAWGVTDECSYLICAFVEGGTLAEAAPGLALRERMELLAEVIRVVAIAHRAGVIHRDLKPANVLVTPQGQVRLIDFGISIGLDQERLTQTGAILGTPAYMPIERLRGSEPHATTDVWALGAMGYELLSGRTPYPAASWLEVVKRREPPPPLVASVNPRVKAVILRALSPEPKDRFQNADAMLEALLESLGERARPRGLWVALALAALTAVATLTFAARGTWAPRPALSHADTRGPAQSLRSPALEPNPPASTAPLSPGGRDLAALPVLLREGFTKGQLSARWTAQGQLSAELFENEGEECLRVIAQDEGYVCTRPEVVAFPDMNKVQAVAIRMRAPLATPSAKVPIDVLLGGDLGGALIHKTLSVTSEWQTYRFELRWMNAVKRAFPRATDISKIVLRLLEAGVLEVSKFELLGGKRVHSVGPLLGLAFPGKTTFRPAKEAGLMVFHDLADFEDQRLVTVVGRSQDRLREALGSLETPRSILLLLFKERLGLVSFWGRFATQLGAKVEFGPQTTTAAHVFFGSAIYEASDAGRLDCVEVCAQTLLARSLRMHVGFDWLFEGVAAVERVRAHGTGLGDYLGRVARVRAPLASWVRGDLPQAQRWQAALFVHWLQIAPQAPISFGALLQRFRDAGEVDLEAQLEGVTLQELDTAWWAWVRATFPEFEPAE
jgi:hypothetical protein